MLDYSKVADGLLTFVKAYTDKAVAGLTQRVAALESATPKDGRDGKDGANGFEGKSGLDGKDGRDGVPGRDGKDGEKGIDGRNGVDGINGRDGANGNDGKDGSKGLNGLDGLHGTNGIDGKDGADGVGFDNLTVDYDGERTATIKFIRGDVVKEFPITFPIPLDRGVFKAGETYLKGDIVSLGGSMFIAQEETTDKPETSKSWRLAVKRGRDGRDGQNGERGEKGLPGERGRDLTQLGPDGSKW